MVRRAEVALHYAKRVSRGGFQVLDEALDRAFLDRGWLAAHLLDAADRGELRLHFQPIVSAVSREMVGVEALVRWEHPERGLLGPNEFIPLAEESGSISSIGRWVLREACATLKHWAEAEPAAAHLSVSVNLSVAELQDRNLVKDVAEALKRSGLAPERLHLEVTESVLSTDPEAAARALAQLRDLGVWLVIDDFGTGHSSLTALQRFPFRVLKIDRSFVGGIGIRPADETIVTATLALAHGLGLSVVAEGVETPEQAEFLTRGGCEELQGYLCGRPAPAAVIQPLLGVECLRRTA
jgi:Amt family ammonium transporter